MNSYTKILCNQCKVYYGSEDRKGMCSVCYKEFNNTQKQIEEVQKIDVKIANSVNEETIEIKNAEVNKMEEEPKLETKPIQTNTYNCWVCNIKVGYLGFKCKCDYIFCGSHRHFSAHNCTFDYKTYDREKLVQKGNHFGETAMSK